ncbi:hypothetical protein CRUP_030340 [Coryphaenoides rupestris]|nr:hypothetical protein CRUP_030340 [Coryphaenoides rupestris]
MASILWAFMTDFFTYETTKSVVVKNWSVGIINRVAQLLIIFYFVGYVFIYEKAYQLNDTAIQSSVMTKVKGFGYQSNAVLDVADYVYPPQGANVFCIITKVIVTDNQTRGLCEENSIRFPLFNVTRGNFPKHMTPKDIKSCTNHPDRSPLCPIFRVSDILNSTGQDVHTLAKKGGEIGINIEWNCNLDWDEEFCKPVYSFSWLDAPFAKNPISQGYNFRSDLSNQPIHVPAALRFARYYKKDNGMDYRTLFKAHAIRFDIMVTGKAGKFSAIPTLLNMVAAFTSIGLGTVLCDIILLNFMKGADQYKAKKFEEVKKKTAVCMFSFIVLCKPL